MTPTPWTDVAARDLESGLLSSTERLLADEERREIDAEAGVRFEHASADAIDVGPDPWEISSPGR